MASSWAEPRFCPFIVITTHRPADTYVAMASLGHERPFNDSTSLCDMAQRRLRAEAQNALEKQEALSCKDYIRADGSGLYPCWPR